MFCIKFSTHFCIYLSAQGIDVKRLLNINLSFIKYKFCIVSIILKLGPHVQSNIRPASSNLLNDDLVSLGRRSRSVYSSQFPTFRQRKASNCETSFDTKQTLCV
jgi:hypothetical protein